MTELNFSEQLTHAVDYARHETAKKIECFLQENGIRYIIALIGDSATDGTLAVRNTAIITEFFETLQDKDRYAIQTGGTQGGIPEIGTKLAKKHNVATIGIYPRAARGYALEEPVDLAIETPDLLFGRTSFGSETPTFVNIPDGAVILGGSYGTRAEISTMLRTNKSRQDALKRHIGDSSLPQPIQLCPIAGTGRSADELITMELYEDIGDCLPTPRDSITSGLAAAAFMNNRLPL